MKKILLILLVSSTILLGNVGKITSIKGEVFINRDNKQIPAKAGSILELQDSISTKDKAKALLLFNDKTSISIGKNSVLDISSFVLDLEEPKKSEAKFKFGKGLFKTITGQIGKINKNKFKIETKSASIGIRGTVFLVEVQPTELKIGVEQGGIFMTPTDLSLPPVDLDVGEALSFNTETNEVQIQPLSQMKETIEEEEAVEEQEETEEQTTNGEQSQESKEQSTNEVVVQEENIDLIEEETESPVIQEVNTAPSISNIIETIEKANDETESKEDDTNDETESKEDDTIDSDSDEKANDETESKEDDTIDPDPVNPINDIPLTEDIDTITHKMMNENSDTYMEFGHALNLENDLSSAYGVYITGDVTPTEVIESYMSSGATAQYSGEISSLVNGVASTGTINVNVNFGAKTFSGNINIPKGDWQANINNGSLTPNSLSATNITGSSSYGTIDSGALNGKFYGPSANNIGGTLNLKSGSNSASGAFGAEKN